MRVNYEEFTITCDDTPCKESLKIFYSILIDNFIKNYGVDSTKEAIKRIKDEDE